MSNDPTSSIRSLVRASTACIRLIDVMHRHNDTLDVNEELAHILANIEHVQEQINTVNGGKP